jgi:hypothetical protein
VEEKTHKEEPNKAHDVPKPIWTGEVTECEEQERIEHNDRADSPEEAVEFPGALATTMAGCVSPK